MMTDNTQTFHIGHEAIMASAGCGKTEELAMRYIRLLAVEPQADTILALTFTRAAAGEMLGRVLLRLAEAVLNDEKREELAFRLHLPEKPDKLQFESWLAIVLRNLHRLRISTLDSFFVEIAGCFALELGIDPGTQLLDDYTASVLKTNAIRDIFSRARSDKSFLNELQKTFSTITQSSEKRNVQETLINSIDGGYGLFMDSVGTAWESFPQDNQPCSAEQWSALIEELESPEIIEKLNKRGKGYFDGYLETLHAGQWKDILSKGPIKSLLGEKEDYCGWTFSAEEKELLMKVAHQAEARLVLDARKATTAFHTFLSLYHVSLCQQKSAARLEGFSDISRMLKGIISPETDAEGMYIYFRLDGSINHLLIDEFQDTSWDQWKVLEPIADEIITDPTGSRSYFMVGDVKQAIYGWRGGDARLFGTILRYYNSQRPDQIRESTLVKSFRSGDTILGAVNAIFEYGGELEQMSYLAAWRKATGFTRHESAVNARRPGYCELRHVPVEGGRAPEKLAERLVAVAELLAMVQPWNRGLTSAVICRKNSDVDEALFALRSAQIPCFSQGKSRLFEDPAVQGVLALLRWADTPDDSLAAFHARHSFLGSIIPVDTDGALRYLRDLRNSLIYTSYPETLEKLIHPWITAIPSASRKRLLQLTDHAAQYQPFATPRPVDFVTYVEESVQREPAASEGVVCTTIHASKGMTFDVVLLPHIEYTATGSPQTFYTFTTSSERGLEEPQIESVLVNPGKEVADINPLFNTMYEQADQQKRLEYFNGMYVALTRAAHALYMFYTEPKKNTGAELIQTALGSDGPDAPFPEEYTNCIGEAEYSKGDPRWYRKFNPTEEKPEPGQAEGYSDIPRITLSGVPSRRRPYITPSAAEQTGTINRSEWFARGAGKGAERGTVIHALLSSVAWIEPGDDPQNYYETQARIARRACRGITAEECDRYIHDFYRILALPAIGELLVRPEEACEVGCEESFVCLAEGKIIRGQYDRVVYYPSRDNVERIELYDYKTDDVTSEEDIRAAVKKYTPQMKLYVQSLQKNYSVSEKQISGHLVFTKLGEIVSVT